MLLYHHLREGRFLQRPNRFIALCETGGAATRCHVKNTGRCRELLEIGTRVWLEESDAPGRKTRFDLVAVESRGHVVNLDSQAPNAVFAEFVRAGGFLPGVTLLRAETTFGGSRFDFFYERAGGIRGFAEIKGVTLFDETGTAFFPDAPTERGVKHLLELMAARGAGYETSVCFLLQRDDVHALRPNDLTHPAFGDALRAAAAAGVMVRALECHVTPETMTVQQEVPALLSNLQDK